MSVKNLYKIAAYVRVSTEDQAENPEGSIKNQEARLRQWVEFKNTDSPFGEIVDVFIDTKSAKNTNRPELKRMLKMVEDGRVNLVMATELSRITRSIRDFAEIWDLLRQNNCSFLSLRENVDTTTAAGEMVLYTMANLAQFERRQIGERVSANFQVRAQRGLYNGGPVSIGYRLIPEKSGYLEIDPECAEIVKDCFATFLREGTLANAAKNLNDRGIKLKQAMQGGGNYRNREFTFDNLHAILKNHIYLGLKKYSAGGENKLVKAVWPAIIDQTTFDRVQDLLKKNKSRKKPHSKRRWPYLLSGILFCKKCGDRLAGKSAWGRAGKIPYYEHALSCKRNATLTVRAIGCQPVRFRAEPIEEIVWRETKAFLSGTLLKDLLTEAKSKNLNQRSTSDRERITIKIQSISGQLEALTERLSQLPKSVSATHIFKQMERLELEKNDFTEKLKSLPDKPTDLPVDIDTVEKFKKSLEFILARESDPVAKSHIIQKIVHKIEIRDDELIIAFNMGKSHYEQYRCLKDVNGPSSDINPSKNFLDSDSKSLTNGRGGGPVRNTP